MQVCALIEARSGSRQGIFRHLAKLLDRSLPGWTPPIQMRAEPRSYNSLHLRNWALKIGRSDQWSLQVWALNEAHAGSVKGVFRPWAERLDMSLPTLDSNEDDPELLIHVPFNGSVKIKVCLHLHVA